LPRIVPAGARRLPRVWRPSRSYQQPTLVQQAPAQGTPWHGSSGWAEPRRRRHWLLVTALERRDPTLRGNPRDRGLPDTDGKRSPRPFSRATARLGAPPCIEIADRRSHRHKGHAPRRTLARDTNAAKPPTASRPAPVGRRRDRRRHTHERASSPTTQRLPRDRAYRFESPADRRTDRTELRGPPALAREAESRQPGKRRQGNPG